MKLSGRTSFWECREFDGNCLRGNLRIYWVSGNNSYWQRCKRRNIAWVRVKEWRNLICYNFFMQLQEWLRPAVILLYAIFRMCGKLELYCCFYVVTEVMAPTFNIALLQILTKTLIWIIISKIYKGQIYELNTTFDFRKWFWFTLRIEVKL